LLDGAHLFSRGARDEDFTGGEALDDLRTDGRRALVAAGCIVGNTVRKVFLHYIESANFPLG